MSGNVRWTRNAWWMSLVAAGTLGSGAGLAACVGDAPSVNAQDAGGGGGDATSGSDATTGMDGAPSSDGAGGGTDAAPDAPTANDGGTGDAAPDGAAPWTPAALDTTGQLALWLDADPAQLVLSSGKVEVWKDKSSHKNDASNPTDGPTVSSAVINGRDALHFTTFGLALSIPDNASLQFGTAQIYIAAVARDVALGAGRFFCKVTTGVSGAGTTYVSGLDYFATQTSLSDGGTGTRPIANVATGSNNQVDWGDAVFEDGKFHLVALRRTNQFTFTMQVDDLAPRTTSTSGQDLSQAGQPALVGGLHLGTFNPPTDFSLAEVVVLHASAGVIADADVASLHAYLKQKYGL